MGQLRRRITRPRPAFACGFVAFIALAGNAGGSPGPQPAAAGPPGVTVTRQAVAARIDAERKVAGVAMFHARAGAEVRAVAIALDPDLSLTGARLRLGDGDPWAAVALEGDPAHGVVNVRLTEALAAGARFTLEVDFRALPQWLNLGDGIYVTAPGRSWHPRLGEAPVTFELEAPEGIKVALAGVPGMAPARASGPEEARGPGFRAAVPGLVLLPARASAEDFQAGQLRVWIRGARPRAGAVVVDSGGDGGAPIQSTQLSRPPGSSAGAPSELGPGGGGGNPRDTLSVTRNPWGETPAAPLPGSRLLPLPYLALAVLGDFQSSFGPLPWQQLELVETRAFRPGVSWPGLVVVPRADGPARDGAFHSLSEETYFELARQWWGHAVRPGREEDRWLLDALAEHALALVVEQRRGRLALGRFRERARERALAEAPPGATLASGGGGPAWRALKGVFVLEGLRVLLHRPGSADPDAAWFGVLRELASTYAGASPTTEDFQRLVERHLPPVEGAAHEGRLGWYFDQWVRGAEVPVLTASLAAEKAGRDSYRITGSVALAGVSDTFRALVPLDVDLGGVGAALGHIQLLGTNPGVVDITVTLPAKPKRVVANLHHELLTRDP